MAWWLPEGVLIPQGQAATSRLPTRFLLCTCLLWLSGAQAAWAPAPVAQLSREADVVAVARVKAVSSRDGAAIATLEILQILKAPARFDLNEYIKVRFISPVVAPGTRRFVVAEEVSYAPGEQAMVFLKGIPDSHVFETVAGIQGKLSVVEGRVGAYDMSLADFIREIRRALPATP